MPRRVGQGRRSIADIRLETALDSACTARAAILLGFLIQEVVMYRTMFARSLFALAVLAMAGPACADGTEGASASGSRDAAADAVARRHRG
jgi:hypothetical protein